MEELRGGEAGDTGEGALVHPEAVGGCLRPCLGERLRSGWRRSSRSSRTRAHILHALSLEELCVGDVAKVAGLSVSAASHQLKRLRDRGVVSFRKKGQLALYRLSDAHIRRLIEDGVEHISASRAVIADFG